VLYKVGQERETLLRTEHEHWRWHGQPPDGIERFTVVQGWYGKIEKNDVGFRTPKHDFQLIDTVGHIQFEDAPGKYLAKALILYTLTPANQQPECLIDLTHTRSMVW